MSNFFSLLDIKKSIKKYKFVSIKIKKYKWGARLKKIKIKNKK